VPRLELDALDQWPQLGVPGDQVIHAVGPAQSAGCACSPAQHKIRLAFEINAALLPMRPYTARPVVCSNPPLR
jgi:hypothetical protein